MRPSRVLSWSGGKDSAHALDDTVDALLTTYDEATGYLPHTRVTIDVIRRQARALRLPQVLVPTPNPWDDLVYESRLRSALDDFTTGSEFLFGDLHLAALRQGREDILGRAGFRAVFPVWTADPDKSAHDILARGIAAIIVSVDTNRLDIDNLAKPYDHAFLHSLPAGVDPCGENGEFQTLVTRHPRFEHPLTYRLGHVHQETSFASVAVT